MFNNCNDVKYQWDQNIYNFVIRCELNNRFNVERNGKENQQMFPVHRILFAREVVK